MIPANLIIITIIGKYVKKGLEVVNIFHYLIFRILEALLNYIVFKLFPDILIHENIYSYAFLVFNKIYIQISFGLATSFLSNAIFINHGTLFNRISDPTVGATSLTLINSIHNLGGAV